MICIRQRGKTCTLYTSSRSLAAAQQCQSPFAVQLEAVQQATPIASPKSIPFQASQKCLTKAARESPFSAKILKPCLQDKCCFGKQNPAKHSCQRRPGCKTRWQKSSVSAPSSGNSESNVSRKGLYIVLGCHAMELPRGFSAPGQNVDNK